MTRYVFPVILALAMAWGLGARPALGQAPTLPLITHPEPGSTQSSLGLMPGAGAVPFGNLPGAGEDVLGGRMGTAYPRVPSMITMPGGVAISPPPPPEISPVVPAQIVTPPLYGPLDRLLGPEEEGPPHGLTLDMAIERLVRENLDLKSRYFEIPQAEADILTASLRANPLLYADSQLVPYGQYSNQRPGGPLQFDLNITYPLDLSRKRLARTLVAARAKQVLEAQYQDAVRIQIDNLDKAFIDVLAARMTVQIREKSLLGLNRVVDATRKYFPKGGATRPDVSRVELLHDSAELLLKSDQEALLRAKRALATLLNFPPNEADRLEIRGTIHDAVLPPPAGDDLIQIALEARPDLTSYRLGIQRAEADVKLARANRFQDVYALFQPYTFQNLAPLGLKSATSWAVGFTVPLPLYNRNQGHIQRTRLNVTQTQTELIALMRQVITEVQHAEREYLVTRDAVQTIEQKMLPKAQQMKEDAYKIFTGGERDVIAYLNTEAYYNEILRLYYETLIRHRRSMLNLNTAVGQRILP